MTRLGFVVNLDACSDHRGCMMACKAKNKSFLGSHYIETFTSMSGDFPNVNTYFLPMMCQHCELPACAEACREDVIFKREDGLVVMGDTAPCRDCDHPCVEACPFGRVFLDPTDGSVGKCDGCADLVDAGGQPACIPNCWMSAIAFGDLEDPTSMPRLILEQLGHAAHQLESDADTEPGVFYILSKKKWTGMESLYSPAWHNDEPELEWEAQDETDGTR